MALGIIVLVLVLFVVLAAVQIIAKSINWTIVVPIIIVIGVLVYLKKRKENTEIYNVSETELLDVNAPVELTGAYKCASCGGVTVIKKTDTAYVCKFCGSELLEAEKDAEQIRRERRWKNSERQKQIDKEHEISMKNMEIRQEQLRMKAEKAKTRNTVLAIVIPIAVVALIVVVSVFVVKGFWHELFGSIFRR